ncbi:MAG TPA: CPBP family intramembrane glutamic endopeptidase [Puia sp.]|nr:CPBP family intramembrane glutamic endopeptidase [Puia sp.]
MNIFFQYLKDYFRAISPRQLLLTAIFTALLVFLNYSVGIEKRIKEIHPWYGQLTCFFIFYLFVFGTAYLFQATTTKSDSLKKNSNQIITSRQEQKLFLVFFSLAPLFFSFKMVHWNIFPIVYSRLQGWDKYWSIVVELPLKLIALLITLFLIKVLWRDGESFWGLTTKNFMPLPYLLILLCMIPFIAYASTRPDFLHAYPKFKNVAFIGNYTQPAWPWKLLFEISYGLDFVGIELFFRGFLVIGFARFVGIHAILPMAAFYCTVHFGKPLGECISSFFGGLALGVIAYRTKSIVGGLLAHLGIAYLMEIGGYAGALYFR